MRLSAGENAERAVEVLAEEEEVDGLGDVDGVEARKKGEAGDGTEGEARVDFAPAIAGEGAVGALKGGNDWRGRVRGQTGERKRREDI